MFKPNFQNLGKQTKNFLENHCDRSLVPNLHVSNVRHRISDKKASNLKCY